MQVHAGSWRHLPTLISAAHARRKCKCKPGRLLRRRGDAGWAGWCGGRGRAQVAVVLERARMAALETNAC
jgi:hypothetical protein